MHLTLNARTWISMAVLAAVMGSIMFVSAGTIHYWQAWVYLSVFFGTSMAVTVYLMRHAPALLERRMKGGPTAEPRWQQKVIMVATSLGFIALLVVPGLDVRNRWSSVSTFAVATGNALLVIGFYVIFLVYKENAFASATIGVVEGQKVVSTGPYAVVRHPMYAGGLLYLVGTPIALGSFWGLVAFALIVPFLIWRLFDEERLLSETLAGYRDYQRAVRHRLVPGIW